MSVATVGILVLALVVAWSQVKEARRARHAHLLLDLSRRWDDQQLVDSRQISVDYETPEDLREAVKGFRERRHDNYFVLLRIPNFFEHLGLLYHQETVSLEILDNWLGSTIIREWDRWELTVTYLREVSAKTNYHMWEALARQARQHRPTDQQPHPS